MENIIILTTRIAFAALGPCLLIWWLGPSADRLLASVLAILGA